MFHLPVIAGPEEWVSLGFPTETGWQRDTWPSEHSTRRPSWIQPGFDQRFATLRTGTLPNLNAARNASGLFDLEAISCLIRQAAERFFPRRCIILIHFVSSDSPRVGHIISRLLGFRRAGTRCPKASKGHVSTVIPCHPGRPWSIKTGTFRICLPLPLLPWCQTDMQSELIRTDQN